MLARQLRIAKDPSPPRIPSPVWEEFAFICTDPETLAPTLLTALMDSLAIPPPTLAKDSLPAPLALPTNVLMDYIVLEPAWPLLPMEQTVLSLANAIQDSLASREPAEPQIPRLLEDLALTPLPAILDSLAESMELALPS